MDVNALLLPMNKLLLNLIPLDLILEVVSLSSGNPMHLIYVTISTQPSFQAQAVNAYLKSGVTLPSRSYGWNPANRGFPDIGAIGENVCVIDPGTPCEPIGGTSASCPLIASLITLLNQDRLNAGKSPLGYVNQVIYAMFYKVEISLEMVC